MDWPARAFPFYFIFRENYNLFNGNIYTFKGGFIMKKFLNSKVTDMTWKGYLGFIAVIYGGMYLFIHSGDVKDWIGKKIKKN